MNPARQLFLLRSDNMRSDEFMDSLGRVFGQFHPGLLRQEQRIAIAGVYGRYEGVSFRRLSFRGELISAMPADDEISFVFPTAGKVVFDLGSETVGLPQIALAIEKNRVRSVGFIDDHAHQGMSISRTLLTRRLAALLERPIVQRLQFSPQVDLNNGACHGLKAMLGLATSTEFEPLMQSGALLPGRLQEMLIDAVLQAWPHNYSAALQRPAPQIAPRHVRLAMEYIQAHPAAQLSGSELAALVNVSQRALQEGFRRFVGLSIVAYQRQVRLQRAYTALQQDGGQSVSALSLALGFSNVGRFCHYFQHAYGLSPAEHRRFSTGF